MMHARKIQSILMIAFLAAVTTFSSSTFLTPALAQTGATQPSTDTGGATGADTGGATGADTGGATGADTGGATGADTGAANQDYQEFETCLTEAEGGEGFATEDEIRECFQPTYIGSVDSQDEESDGGSQDEESDGGSQDEDNNNSEPNGSGN